MDYRTAKRENIDSNKGLYYNVSRQCNNNADVAELADALDSGSSEGFFMQVQVLSSAKQGMPVNIAFTGIFYLCYVKLNPVVSRSTLVHNVENRYNPSCEPRAVFWPDFRKEARLVTVFEALMIALTFGLLIVAMMDKTNKHNKK